MGMHVHCFCEWPGFLCGVSALYWIVRVLPLSGVWRVGCGFFMNGECLRGVSKIALGNIVWLSFKWLLAVYSHYVHAEYTVNNHLNDSHTIFPSVIFTLLNNHQP